MTTKYILGLCIATDPTTGGLSNCVNHVWRDQKSRWQLGCQRVGSAKNPNPSYQCALKTNTEGYSTLTAKCSPSNPEICRMLRARLSRNQTVDYIYEL